MSSEYRGKILLKTGTLAERLGAVSDEFNRPSVASDAGLAVFAGRILAQPGQITPAAISGAGTTTPTLKAWQQRTQIFQTVSAGSGSYTAKVVLAAVANKITSGTMTPPAGQEVILSLAMPASTHPTIEIRNATDSGTVLATIAGAATARTVLVHCAFNGTAWVLLGVADAAAGGGPSNAQVAAYHLGNSLTGTITLLAANGIVQAGNLNGNVTLAIGDGVDNNEIRLLIHYTEQADVVTLDSSIHDADGIFPLTLAQYKAYEIRFLKIGGYWQVTGISRALAEQED